MKPNSRILTLAVGVLAGALLAGGSYALGAGNSSKTISGCVVKSSHELLIENRCGRGESRLSWAQEGPRGLQGLQGKTGPQGPSAADAWAAITATPPTAFVSGQNITAQYDGVGLFTVTPGGTCSSSANSAVIVTPTPSSVGAGETPVAYVGLSGAPAGSFQVTTGYLSGGTFTANNVAFSVAVFCNQS